MAYIDYYQVFGVDKTASQDALRRRSVSWRANSMSCAVS